MSLSLAEIKRAKVQTFRDVADGLDGMAAANRDMKRGIERLPIMGDAWKGLSGDAAHHEFDGNGRYLEGHADAQTGAASKIRRAADEFEGVQQLLKKIENDAANGKFTINLDTGEVTPPSGKYDKNELDYLRNTLKQIQAAGDTANTDLEAAVKAAKALPDPSGAAAQALPTTPTSAVHPGGPLGALQNQALGKPDGAPGATQAAAADTQANYKEWYPKAVPGDKSVDPSKLGGIGGTIEHVNKNGTPLPPAKPAFGEGVARKFGAGVNSRVDGIVEEVKNLTGQGGPGSPGVAESWLKAGMGFTDQVANPLTNLPGDIKDVVNDPAGFAGKKLFDVGSIAATGPLGGEATAGARGLLGDLTSTEGRALTHGPLGPHEPPAAVHGPVEPPSSAGHPEPVADHPAPATGHPDLHHVSAESGGTGAWNHELNNPQPNTHYNVDDKFQYNTDTNSRVGHAHADLDASSAADRNGYQQRIAGGPDRLPGDQGGHIFGSQFGGPGEAINLTAMRDTLNSVGNREYYNLEGDWRTYIGEGKQVSVDVEITYPGDSRRPEMYSVKTYVDGNLDSVHSFRN